MLSGELFPGGMWLDASSCELEMTPLPADEVVEGAPATGSRVFVDDEWSECGVWEMSPGIARDVEVEEVFVVISGEALLTRQLDSAQQDIALRPGVMVRLNPGEQTVWAVTSPLRKVYWMRKTP